MRHGLSGNKFGRNQTLRAATVRDLCKAVLKFERIKTTKAKAVEARKLVDKMITIGKKGTLAAKRRAFAILCDHGLVSSLFNVIAPRFVSRQGGYTRMIKYALNRRGDNAEMVILELTEKSLDAQKSDAKVVDTEIANAEVVEAVPEEKKSKKTSVKKSDVKAKKTTTKKASAKKA